MPQAKLAGKLPKGDRDGLNAVAEIIGEDAKRKRVFVVVAHSSRTDRDNDSDDADTTENMTIDRIEMVDDRVDETIARDLMLRAAQRRNGGRVLPFELTAALDKLFPDLVDRDEQEAAEDDEMSAEERMRRHLERMHGYNGQRDDRPKSTNLTNNEAAEAHRADHENRKINHRTDWVGWTRADVADLPRFVLAFEPAETVWALYDRGGQRLGHIDLEQAEVDKARAWGGEQVESLGTGSVIRWYNSDVIADGWVPVVDDQVQKPAQSHGDGSDPQSDPTLFDDPRSLTSDTAGRADGAESSEAIPADDADSFSALLIRMTEDGVEINEDAVREQMNLVANPDSESFVAEQLDRLVEAGKIERIIDDTESGRTAYRIPAGFDATAADVPPAVFSAPGGDGSGPVDLDSDTRSTRAARMRTGKTKAVDA